MAEKSGLDISISVFVHYRELNSVKYEAAEGRLKIEVALRGLVDEKVLTEFVDKTKNSLYLYYNLSQVKPVLSDVEYTTQAGITLVRFYRDINSLSESEVDLFVIMLRDSFSSLLIIDDTNDVDSEERYTREIKRNLLHNHKSDITNPKNFFGYRDHGTMFVFDK